MTTWQESFWVRLGLQKTDKAEYIEAIKRRYDGHHVDEFEYQGYCSFTLLISWPVHSNTIDARTASDDHTPAAIIVQIRPTQHALDIAVAREANRLYASLAPEVRCLDIQLPGKLRAYELSRLPGTPLSRLLPHTLMPGTDLKAKQETLITSFAHIIAQGWLVQAGKKRRDSVLRLDSPSMEKQSMLLLCTGKVGSRITQKLEKLARELPDQWLRDRAMTTLDRICALNDYPVVLNHGDLIPSNILVGDQTWCITGLVDWAEAEHLPFGTCLYGLEHLLGFVQPASPDSSRPVVVYQNDATRLRQLFWTTLISVVPELEGMREEVQVMRDLGVLLWHGYAWDEGAIDRVVDEVDDGEELAKLRAFLSI
jgi:hypothetical protein